MPPVAAGSTPPKKRPLAGQAQTLASRRLGPWPLSATVLAALFLAGGCAKVPYPKPEKMASAQSLAQTVSGQPTGQQAADLRAIAAIEPPRRSR